MSEQKLVLTVVVSGENMMGGALCSVNGVLYGKRSRRVIEYCGPVNSAEEVADAIADLFREPQP